MSGVRHSKSPTYYTDAMHRYGTQRATAQGLGCTLSCVQNGLLREGKRAATPQEAKAATLTFPQFSKKHTSTKDLIKRLAAESRLKDQRAKEEKWFNVHVHDNKPIGIMWVGDPHLGVSTDWDRLHQDVLHLATVPGLYGANIGDTTDNWVGSLMRIFSEQDISNRSARDLAKWFLTEAGITWLVWIFGNHDCVTPDHEVLTQRGWLPFPDVRQDDKVYGLNAATGDSEWQAIGEVVSFGYVGPLYKWSGSRFSLRCTPNHRVLHQQRTAAGRTRPFSYKFAADMPKEFRVARAASRHGARESGLTDTQIALAAWVLADGWIQKPGYYRIGQSKAAGCAEIERLLMSAEYAYTKDVRVRGLKAIGGKQIKSALPATTFFFTAEASRAFSAIVPAKHRLPEWCWRMSAKQFEVFLGAYIRADGTEYGEGRNEGTAIIYGQQPMLDDLQSLCVQYGRSASITKDPRSGSPRLNVCRLATADVAAFPEIESYNGKVWCLRVPLKNFMVRHNGIAHFTGNSWNDGDEILKLMNIHNRVPMLDWIAKFQVCFPDGTTVRIRASHDLPGHSMWNPTHGPSRAPRMLGDGADLYVAGHKHTWGIQHFEMPEANKCPLAIRARGYKRHDPYARRHGFPEDQHGCSILTIIDPTATGAGRVSAFVDVDQGVRVLQALRGDVASPTPRSKVRGGKTAKRRQIKKGKRK